MIDGMFTLLILIVIVLAILLAVAIFFLQQYLFPDLTNAQERLADYRHQQDQEAAELKARQRDVSKLFKDSGFSNEQFARLLSKNPAVLKIRQKLIQSGNQTLVDQFIFKKMVLPVIVVLVLTVITGFFPMLLLVPVIPGVMMVLLHMRAQGRMKKLSLQLPNALNLLTTSLRAGHAFQSGLSLVVSEMTDPINKEFGEVVNAINLGIPLKTALNKLVDNLNLTEIRMFAVSVIIQREAGGNLAEILEKLGDTIRARQQLKGQISALTAQSRLTGYLLGVAPMLVLIVLTLFMYSYVAPLYEENIGRIGLGISVVMITIGFFIIQKIVDIEL